MFFYTYVLQSLKDNNNYIGYTKDLVKRVKEHKLG
ncbi:MAG: GIY-YIG nuclease family protein, partial [Patescibacteria group bacterium]